MATSEAKKRADLKWQQEKVEDIRLRVPKGKKAAIQAFAAENGESVNGLLNRLVDEALSNQ